jgi:hypothetical protein
MRAEESEQQRQLQLCDGSMRREDANRVGCCFRGGAVGGRCGGATWIAGAVVALGPGGPPDRALAAAATTIMAAAEPTNRILRWVIRSMSYIEALMTPELARYSDCARGR